MTVRRPHARGFSVPEARGDTLPERGRERPHPDDALPRRDGGRAGAHASVVAGAAAPAGLRIHKAMAQAGVASRREAERMIEAGQVRVNGKDVVQPGRLLAHGDALEVSGRPIAWEERAPPELWALYKPKRCVCTLSDPQGRRTVKDYFPRTAQRLFPVGRLDYDAEGLLLLTSDGALAQRVMHPSFRVPRVYLVKVRGAVQPATLRDLARGVELEGRLRQPARTRVLHKVNDKTWLEVVLKEGLQHHIKKMFQAVGHPVLKIKRYQIGPIELGDLQPGQSRRLGQADMERLTHWAETDPTGRAAPRIGASRRRRSTGPGAADEVPLLRVPAGELA